MPQPCISYKVLTEFDGGKEPLDDDSVPSTAGGALIVTISKDSERVGRSLPVARSRWAMTPC